jgi:hypothetical protein
MPGRKMKGFTTATGAMLQDKETLRNWVVRSLEHAKAMPKKSKASVKRQAKRSKRRQAV